MSLVVRKRGFTLIELLVVVAIIALLISILLPSLRDAREQAKIAKCVSNLKGMSLGTALYFQDFQDQFPGTFWTNGVHTWCTWSFAGKTSRDLWKTEDSGYYFLPATQRPLNKYIMGGTPIEPDLMDGTNVSKRTEIPPLQCPSDKDSHQAHYYDDMEAEPISSYDDIGTSYHYNIHALLDAVTASDSSADSPEMVDNLMRVMLQETTRGLGSTLTFYQEDPVDYAYKDMTVELGNHGKLNKHAVGFLDGHAEYRAMDTRRWCGLGYQSMVPRWDKLAYPFNTKLPVWYTLAKKTCNPTP